MPDPNRLYSALLNTGLQQKDNPLYQVLHDLIGLLAGVTPTTPTFTGGSGGGGGTTIINNNIQNNLFQISDFDGSNNNDDDNSFWPPGIVSSGSSGGGTDAFIPYFIGPTEIFTIPVNKQGLFTMNIDNEGILVIDGFLIEVD